MRSPISAVLPIPKKEDLVVLWVTKSAQKNGPPKQLFVPTAGSGLLSVGHTHVLNSHLCWMPIKRRNLQERRVSSTMSMRVKYVNLLHAEGDCVLKMLGRTAVTKNKQPVLCCKVSLIQHAELLLMWYIVLALSYCLLLPCVNNSNSTLFQPRNRDKPGFFHPSGYERGLQQQGTTGSERTIPVSGCGDHGKAWWELWRSSGNCLSFPSGKP